MTHFKSALTCGLLDGNKIYDLLSDRIQGMKIEESEIAFCCIATDLLKGEEVQLRSGAMVDAVRASISVPGIFTPFCRGDLFLGDGGLVNPVPVDVARAMGAEVVIAVNLNSNGVGHSEDPQDDAGVEDQPRRASSEAGELRKQSFLKNLSERYLDLEQDLHAKVDRWFVDDDPCPNIFEVIGSSLNVMEQQVTRSRLEAHSPDLLIEPRLNDYAIFDFHKAQQIICRGYTSMKQQLPALQALLSANADPPQKPIPE